ncbi:hypothetical protein [Nocardioides stalactiti]|uniref:hypothetical protein n=1 Tax=Nocardioides stalactiti TaxID=2755356 RepID=UPI001604727D|nr:hypothetical protein [Nocardioides stalactiti]
MSRTDKTQPFRVRLWDGTLSRVAVHDHSDGVCDLPATMRDDLAQWSTPGAIGTSCHWELHWTGVGVCPCSLCHDGAERRAERRADRRRARLDAAEAVKLARAGWREM